MTVLTVECVDDVFMSDVTCGKTNTFWGLFCRKTNTFWREFDLKKPFSGTLLHGKPFVPGQKQKKYFSVLETISDLQLFSPAARFSQASKCDLFIFFLWVDDLPKNTVFEDQKLQLAPGSNSMENTSLKTIGFLSLMTMLMC
jgi:hypothetical protein